MLARALLPALCVGAVPAIAADMPARHPTVEAFRAACLPQRQSYERMKKTVEARGWIASDASAHPELAAVMQLSEEEAAKEADDPEPLDVEMRHAIYRRTIAGADHYLVALEARSEVIDLVSCYIYDFAAAAPLPKQQLDALFGEKPYESINEPGSVVSHKWDTPRNFSGTWDTYTGFMPEGSSVAAAVRFTGAVVRITAIDPKDK